MKDQDPLILANQVSDKTNEDTIKTLSPAVRKIVSEKNLNVEKIKGSGRDGQILKGDLINLMGSTPKLNQRKMLYSNGLLP